MRPASPERSRLREWWPDGVALAAGGLIMAAPVPGGPFLGSFILVWLFVGWLLGHRHRRMPLHDTLNGIYAGMEQMNQQLTEALPAPEPQRPGLYVVRD